MNQTWFWSSTLFSLARVFATQVGIIIFLTMAATTAVKSQADTLSGFLKQQEAAEQAWVNDLYTHGVQIKGDSVYFNDETRLITTDSLYWQLIYPETYRWEMVQALMQRKMLKPAIWYMINLYYADTTHKDLVLKMILPLDQALEMDRVMVAAFYTYIAFDPQVYTIKNGKTVEVKRPDIAEHKLLATEDIVKQIFAQRNLQKTKTE